MKQFDTANNCYVSNEEISFNMTVVVIDATITVENANIKIGMGTLRQLPAG